MDKYSRLYSGRVATLEDGDVFRAHVPVNRTVVGSGKDTVVALVESIIARDGSLTAADLAKAGNVPTRTAQRWIKSLRDIGLLDVSLGDARRCVLADGDSEDDAT